MRSHLALIAIQPDMSSEPLDIALIGGGIMSAHVGTLLKSLAPRLKIEVYEAASELAGESSDAWHNAGTGHAGLCELNYTLPLASLYLSL